MKFALTAFCLVAASITLAAAESSSWGTRNPSDSLLKREHIVRGAESNTYVTEDYVFPKRGVMNEKIISAINVIDHFTNGSGATPDLWANGPGWTHTWVHFKSQHNQGIDSTVEIWGQQ